jgi:ribonucleoside-diphosphate reductase alpha chain
LKGEAAIQDEADVGEADLAKLAFAAPSAKASPAKSGATALDKRTEARMKGYVGESCPECANFTLVRNGTCLKCDTCGSTTGCS